MYLDVGLRLNNRYVIQKVLGQGGFGITYLANDQLLHLIVAIKEYLPRQLAARGEQESQVVVFSGQAGEHYAYGLQKFLEEARILARFSQNPGIVSVRDYFEANNTAYMVMEFIEGQTLKEYLTEHGGKISWDAALRVLLPVLEALEQVHAAGLLHRDISPDNIFLTIHGEVKLLDFGAARYYAGEHSRSLSVILKPGYAPEEQYRSSGKQGAWTDVYAAAATLYRVITGTTPPESLDRLAEDTLVPPSRSGLDLPGAGEKALLQALMVPANQRFQTVRAFREALLGVNLEAPTAALPRKPASAWHAPDPDATLPRRRPWSSQILEPLGGVAAVLLVAISALFFYRSGTSTSSPQVTSSQQISASQQAKKPGQPETTVKPPPPPDNSHAKLASEAVREDETVGRQPSNNQTGQPPAPATIFDPALARIRCEEGRQLYKQSRFAEAVAKLEAAVQHDPGNAQAHYLLGWSYHQLERSPELALASFQAAVSIKPNNALAYDGMTWSYIKLGRYHEALSTGRKTLQINYNFPDAQYNLGMAYLGLGNIDMAMKQYQVLQRMKNEKAELLLRNILAAGTTNNNLPGATNVSPNHLTAEEVLQFVNNYYQTSARGNVNEVMSFYADYVNYYNLGRVPKAEIRQDKARYYKRWPLQLHTIISGVRITGAADDVKQVDFSTRFQVRNDEKNISGVASETWLVQKTGGRVAIIDEKSKVLQRD